MKFVSQFGAFLSLLPLLLVSFPIIHAATDSLDTRSATGTSSFAAAGSNTFLDWLLADLVFKANTVNVTIEGLPTALPRAAENKDTFWANIIAGGLEPKRQRYFIFRPATNPGHDALDIVFFNDDGTGFFVVVPKERLSGVDQRRIEFYSVATGGGESGHGTVKTNYKISSNFGGSEPLALSILINSTQVWQTVEHLYREEKSSWHAELHFEPAVVLEPLLASAKRISIKLGQYNKLEDEKLFRERKEKR
jgi:hypothetical protein